MKTFVGYCNCPTEVFSFLDGALSLFRALRGVYSERSEAGEGRCGADGGGRERGATLCTHGLPSGSRPGARPL